MLLLILIVVFSCAILIVYALWSEKEIEIKDIKEAYKKYGQRKGFIFLVSPLLAKLVYFNSGLKIKQILNLRATLTRKLASSGNVAGLSADEMIGLSQIAAGLTFLSVFFVGGLLEMSWSARFFFSPLVAILGFFLPIFSLNTKIKRRHKSIRRALPYSLDLLTMTVEAGLDFQAGIGKVVEKGRPGPLNEELFLMSQEIRMGKTRQQALRDMAERVNLPEFSSILSAIIQTEQLGTSLGPILRIQSNQLRIKRFQWAEKLAMEAPIRVLLPLLSCIFPAVFVVLFAPIVFQFIKGSF